MVTLSDQVRDSLANQLKVSPDQVQKVLDFLSEGSTAAYVGQYLQEDTGGLTPSQVASIARAKGRAEDLEQRRASILKSVDNHERLTADIKSQIASVANLQQLEDLYLPFKRKQSSKHAAPSDKAIRELATSIRDGSLPAEDLNAALDKLVSPDSKLPDRDSVLQAVRNTIAEEMSYDIEARKSVRDALRSTAKLICKEYVDNESDDPKAADKESDKIVSKEPNPTATTKTTATAETTTESPTNENTPTQPATEEATAEPPAVEDSNKVDAGAAVDDSTTRPVTAKSETDAQATEPDAVVATESVAHDKLGSDDKPKVASEAKDKSASADTKAQKDPKKKPSSANTAEVRRQQRRESRQRKREHLRASFKPYFSYSESLPQVKPPKLLAINRGERVRVLEVTLESDRDALLGNCLPMLVPAEHAHKELLDACAKQSFANHILPGVERDIRRELTERAERHAVRVFSRNMRDLLLQPPTSKRILAIDPGLRYGCKAVALNERGQLLGETTVHALGDAERVGEGRRRMAELIKKHNLEVIAIGNGTGVRQAETTVSTMLTELFSESAITYTLVNESGTSVYSTGGLANEELPGVDPRARAAVSIGRRLLDPISELVKVDPEQIGSGAYQQDVKLKHLQKPLLSTIEDCVDQVGVDVNTASPCLLRYVSGLDEHTATAIAEHRLQKQPYANLEELKQVSDVSEATWRQAVGFLRVFRGSEPLDATAVHPDQYEAARKLIEATGLTNDQLVAEVQSHRAAIAVPAQPTTATPPTEAPTPETAAAKSPETATTTVTEDAPAATDTAAATETSKQPATENSETATEKNEATTTEDTTPAETKDAAESTPAAPPVTAAPPSAAKTEKPAPTTPETSEWTKKLEQLDIAATATTIGCSRELTQQLVANLKQPGRDCRLDRSAPIMRRNSLRWEDLQPGLEFVATVLSVVEFGAFVDLGIRESGLVHISELANHYIQDPHEVVSVGDSLRLWVLSVDQDKRRVSLTAMTAEQRAARAEANGKQRRGSRPAEKRGKRPERAGGKSRGGPRGGRNQKSSQSRQPRTFEARPRTRKPKAPPVPITDAMKKGKEPMRTFGDLAQFFTDDKSKGDNKEGKDGGGKKGKGGGKKK